MRLSTAQRNLFFRDGYIVIKNLISPDELATLREHYANLILGRVPDFPERHISRHNPEPGSNVGTTHTARGVSIIGAAPKFFQKVKRITKHNAEYTGHGSTRCNKQDERAFSL